MTCEDVWHIKLRSAFVLRSQGRASDQELVVTHIFKISFLILFPVTSCFPLFCLSFSLTEVQLVLTLQVVIIKLPSLFFCGGGLFVCFLCQCRIVFFINQQMFFMHLHWAVELFNTHSCFQITSECVLALSC